MIPDLAALFTDPARVEDIPPAELPHYLAELAALQSAITAKLLSSPPSEAKTAGDLAESAHPIHAAKARPDQGEAAHGNDRLLRIEEAAEILGVSRRWIYAHADTLPFTRRLGPGMLRFSANGLQRYMELRGRTGK